MGGGHCRAPTPHKGAACANFLRASCATNSFVQLNAVQYTISHEFTHDYSALTLNNFELDLGIFLTSRGNFSWLGYGWLGCGCGWSNDGKMPCNVYPRPRALDLDYGTPTQLCQETAPGSGVFEREWTKSTVTVDCNAYTSEIKMKPVRNRSHLKSDDLARRAPAREKGTRLTLKRRLPVLADNRCEQCASREHLGLTIILC